MCLNSLECAKGPATKLLVLTCRMQHLLAVRPPLSTTTIGMLPARGPPCSSCSVMKLSTLGSMTLSRTRLGGLVKVRLRLSLVLSVLIIL